MRLANTMCQKSILIKDHHAQVYFFGSRTGDTKKNGGIDILIISDIIHSQYQLRKIKK